MSRLQIRVFQDLNQSDRWAMVGASTSQEQIKSWLEKYCYKGLILHTGFSVLPREVFIDLLPSARDGIVVCAATKALLSDVFRNMNVEVCHGYTDDGHVAISHMDSWFFLLTSTLETIEDNSDLWLVDSLQHVKTGDANISPDRDINKLSNEMREALEGENELITSILNASISNLEEFRVNWSNLDANQAFEIARLLFNFGIEKFRSRHNLGKDSPKNELKHREGIIHLVRYLPPWSAEVPQEPVRTYNALNSADFSELYDLENEQPIKLLQIPNIGRRSVRLLYEYLISFEVPYPLVKSGSISDTSEGSPQQHASDDEIALEHESFDLKDAPTLSGALESIINEELTKAPTERDWRPFEFLKRRLSGETLESIGETQNLTRERIRQITNQALRAIAKRAMHTIAGPGSHSSQLPLVMQHLFLRSDCSHVDFSNFVRIFSESESLELGAHQRRMLQKMIPQQNIRLVPFQLASKSVVLPLTTDLPESISETLEAEIACVIEHINGMEANEAENYARTHLLKLINYPFFASLIAIEIVYYRSSIDENSGRINRENERVSSKQAISEIVNILRRSGRPLHGIDEIYPKMPEAYQEAVGARRVTGQINEHQERCLGESEDYIFTMGRGRYALWEHFDIKDTDGKECANFIERHLNQHTERQFTDLDLYQLLDSKDMVTWKADHVDRHRIVSALLMRYRPSRVRYLGRFVWSAGDWTDQTDTASRYQINELIEEIIKEKGQPVSKKYIDDYIASTRGRGITAQYHERNGLIRLTGTGKNALYWHESMDPLPFNSLQSQRLRGEIIDLVSNSSELGLYMSGLKADIVYNSDIVSKYNPAQFLSLLLRMPEIKVSKNASNKLLVKLREGAIDA